jgi:hypothetical protein
MDLQLNFLTQNKELQLLCSEKVSSQEDSKFAQLVLQGEKNTFLCFKCYNFAIYVVKYFEIFSTCYFNCPKQDPMVESQKIKIKN